MNVASWSLRAAFLIGLVSSCAADQQTRREVLVRIVVPSVGGIDSLRLTKFVNDVPEPAVLDERLDGGPFADQPTAAVALPEGKTVRLRVQALRAEVVVAAGEVALQLVSGEQQLLLVACDGEEGRMTEACPRSSAGSRAPDAGTLPADAEVSVSSAPVPSDAGADAGSAEAAPPVTCPELRPPLPLPPPTEGPTPQCLRYCEAMATSCQGLSHDDTREQCLRSCAAFAWPVDEVAGSGGDTITCRTRHAELAASFTAEADRRRHCDYALPDSRGACGNSCWVYCRLGARLCGAYFPSMDDCVRACVDRDNQSRKASGEGIYDALHCRMKWVVKAALDPSPAICQRGAPTETCVECPSLMLSLP